MEIKTGDGIIVYCLHDEIVNVTNIIPHDRNPNKHSREQIRLLGKVINDSGWRNPITISKLSGKIIKGHCRLQAAKYMGWSSVPVEYQHYENEYAELADLVADNKIAELAKLDESELVEILKDVKTASMDIELTGFTDSEYESMLKIGTLDEDDFIDDDFELPTGDINEREVMEKIVVFIKTSAKGHLLDAINKIEDSFGSDAIRLSR